jgi:uncharacterized protein YebE (UPF0316 family)
MGSQALRYFFMISALLVIVVYFVGSSTVGSALAHMIQTISYAATGRNSSGNFANYPGGATLPAGVTG